MCVCVCVCVCVCLCVCVCVLWDILPRFVYHTVFGCMLDLALNNGYCNIHFIIYVDNMAN